MGLWVSQEREFCDLLPEPTKTSGFPRVTAAVKSEPRYSPSTCQFTNFDCCVCGGGQREQWACTGGPGHRAAGCAPSHLDGHLGPEARAQLVNDLGVEAAAVVHITHQHREGLGRGRGQVSGQRSHYGLEWQPGGGALPSYPRLRDPRLQSCQLRVPLSGRRSVPCLLRCEIYRCHCCVPAQGQAQTRGPVQRSAEWIHLLKASKNSVTIKKT